MTNEQKTALKIPWWIYHNRNEKLNRIYVSAFLDHWLPRIQAALARNRGSRRPSTLGKLADGIDRHRALLDPRRGRSPSMLLLYNYAFVLGVRLVDLLPDVCELYVSATCRLVKTQGRELSYDNARAYVAYLQQNPGPHNPHLDRAAVESIRGSTFTTLDSAEQAIRTAAQIVGEVLEKDFPGLIAQIRGTL